MNSWTQIHKVELSRARRKVDGLNRLTNRIDGTAQTKYTHAVLGNGMRTFRQDGPWSSDDVIVTNRYSLRSALAIGQPSGQPFVTNAYDSAGRWAVVGGTPGTFTYN